MHFPFQIPVTKEKKYANWDKNFVADDATTLKPSNVFLILLTD